MKKICVFIFALSMLGGFRQPAIASDTHNHGHHEPDNHKNTEHLDHDNEPHEDSHDHHEEGTTHIEHGMAEEVGIKTDVAGPQHLQQSITTYGRLAMGPEQVSHVRARFAGVITSVDVTIGDRVNTGDVLAIVESNESLKKYELLAPIAGVITQRHANTGEMTQEQVLFSIANFESLWAELRIFPSQNQSITAGRLTQIVVGEKVFQSRISHLIPAQENAPYLIARVQLNDTGNTVMPGLMVEGRVTISEFTATCAVRNTGIQTMGGQVGVFIKHNNEYAFTPLILGRTGNQFTEVLSGIHPGNEYVTNNSFLIKADIEKSEAEHVH